jgi:hypothetical protein
MYSRDTVNYTELERLLKHYCIRKNWDKSNIIERLEALNLCKTKDEYKWVIPRIFGIRFFANFKSLFASMAPLIGMPSNVRGYPGND